MWRDWEAELGFCSFCKNVPETWLHLFWECNKVQFLWAYVIQFCKKYVDKEITYSRNECLLLGFGTLILNLIMTLCKYHIHNCQLFDKKPTGLGVLTILL